MKTIKRIFSICLFLMISIQIYAYDFMVGDIAYNIIDAEAKTVEVTSGGNYTGDITIPATVNNEDIVYSVVSIGNSAFYGKSSLTSVSCPSVSAIGTRAFYYCSSLTSVDLSNVTSIGDEAFSICYSLSSVDLSNVTSIGDWAFSGCNSLTSVESPNATSVGEYAFNGCLSLTEVDFPNATSIGRWAFYKCSSLTSVNFPKVLSVGSYAFSSCESLLSVVIPKAKTIGISAFSSYETNDFRYCTKLENLDLSSVESIEPDAFNHCPNIKFLRIGSVEQWCNVKFYESFYGGLYSNPLYASSQNIVLFIGDAETPATEIYDENVTTVPDYAFRSCPYLTSVVLPNATSIGYGAFNECKLLSEIELRASEPQSLGGSLPAWIMITVPKDAYESYLTAPGFSDIPLQIAIKEYSDQDVEIEANDNTSALLAKIGGEHVAKHVVNLKLSGTMNSYDMMVIRNKMTGLRTLDLKDVTIVANDYEYYTGCHSEDSVFGANWLRETPIWRVILPESTKSIGANAFYGCTNLIEANMSEGIKSIGDYALYSASLSKIIIPNSVETIEYEAFGYCTALKELTLGKNVKSIGGSAFFGCSALQKVELPSSIETVGYCAFYGCSQLSEVLVPASIKTIGNQAFSSCPNLNTVVATTVEPVTINQQTFSTFQTASLYVPKTSYWTYYWNTQWSQFLNVKEYGEYSEVPFRYEYFYINNDFTLDDENGRLEGEPDADLNEGSGLIVIDGDVQELGTVHLKCDGSNIASLIGKGTGKVHIDKLIVDIKVQAGRWYFFTFPFDLTQEEIKFGASCAWYLYNGALRALGGSGWTRLTNEDLFAGKGYIFQGSKAGTLSIEKEDVTIDARDLQTRLATYIAENKNNASWNLIGNLCTSYFDMNKTGYQAPITVYNNERGQYEAVRPGDDDYTFHPFQAFFVQKPDGVDNVTFEASKKMTKIQSEKAKAARAAQRKEVDANNPRKLINLTFGNGDATDKTRVVINPEKSMDYELDCDAAKFLDNAVPQIYSVDAKGTQYAINERPEGNGIIKLAVKVPTEGEYTIEATRTDCPVILRDLVLQKDIDISEESYTFVLEAGESDHRFELVVGEQATAIKDVETLAQLVSASDGEIRISGTSAEVKVYNVNGSLVATQKGAGSIKVGTGIYIVSIDGKSVKVSVN